jgi:hypothetical protein
LELGALVLPDRTPNKSNTAQICERSQKYDVAFQDIHLIAVFTSLFTFNFSLPATICGLPAS